MSRFLYIWVLLALFTIVIFISCVNLESSLSLFKYHFMIGIEDLTMNHILFHTERGEFFRQTLSFNEGDTESGWRTAYHLVPLFLFLEMIGGLSIRNLYIYTTVISLLSLILFYCWSFKFWGREVAFFGTVLIGFSSCFQEIARSGTYHAPSLFLALSWILCMHICLNSRRSLHFLVLGMVTGLMVYYYALLRFMVIIPLSALFIVKRLFDKRALLFLAGILLFLLPGVIFDTGHRTSLLDEETFFKLPNTVLLKELGLNIVALFSKFLGDEQYVPGPLARFFHAPLLNRILVPPFLIGFLHLINNRKSDRHWLMLLISFSIFIPPLFSTNDGYIEARRSLLSIVPIYLFVGIGVSRIFYLLNRIQRKTRKKLLYVTVAFVLVIACAWEVMYSATKIWPGGRDIGLLDFGKKIETMGLSGEIYYLNPEDQFSAYLHQTEGAILRLILSPGKLRIKVREVFDFGGAAARLSRFYVVKSPLILPSEFDRICRKDNCTYRLLAKNPVETLSPDFLPQELKGQHFELYQVYRGPRDIDQVVGQSGTALGGSPVDEMTDSVRKN